MDFLKMFEEYHKFSKLSSKEKAEQAVEEVFAIKALEIAIAREVQSLAAGFDSLCELLVKKGLVEQVELNSKMEVANAKAKEEFDQDLAKAKEEIKSEILAELEKTE